MEQDQPAKALERVAVAADAARDLAKARVGVVLKAVVVRADAAPVAKTAGSDRVEAKGKSKAQGSPLK